jgi:hypothetical protein
MDYTLFIKSIEAHQEKLGSVPNLPPWLPVSVLK